MRLRSDISIFLVLVMVLATCASATSPMVISATAQAAFVYDVTATGSNIGDDLNSATTTITMTVPCTIVCAGTGELTVSIDVDGQVVDISGSPVARSENGSAAFFSAVCDNPRYEIVYMAYVENVVGGLYFKNYLTTSSASQVLQIYIRDDMSDSRDYVFLEIFDFEYPDFYSRVANLPEDPTMGSWVAREFVAANVTYTEQMSRAETSNFTRTYRETFILFSAEQTHSITLAVDCTYSNIPRGLTADIIYRLEIIGKTIDCPSDPVLSSSEDSYLRIDALNLRQTTVPNVAFVSESIDGVVEKRNSTGTPTLSASIGVGYGLLSAELSLPTSLSSYATVDINSIYRDFVNGRDGQYTRSNITTMASGLVLDEIGNYFSVRCTLGDFGNEQANYAYHKGRWEVTVFNIANHETTSYLITQNVIMSVFV
jgi:hypothetical protein